MRQNIIVLFLESDLSVKGKKCYILEIIRK